jgi:hypothetical protein
MFTGTALLIFFKNVSFATWLFDTKAQFSARFSFQYAFLTKLNHF